MFIHDKNVIYLNTARNCLHYIIQAYKIKQIFLPYYTCPVVWQSARKENCKIKFYHIDNNFMPVYDFKENDYVVYTNYFGICAKNIESLATKYKNLIVDNSQAFYMKNIGLASFNSIRKFFGNSDGALLFCNQKQNIKLEQDDSKQRLKELLKRKSLKQKYVYTDFSNVDEFLIDEPIKLMSEQTKKFLFEIDFEQEKQHRLQNFNCLNQSLSEINELTISLNSNDIPMYYPLLVKNKDFRQKMLKQGISMEQFWSPINSKTIESDFQKYIFPLPIDMRYTLNDMHRITKIILDYFNQI